MASCWACVGQATQVARTGSQSGVNSVLAELLQSATVVHGLAAAAPMPAAPPAALLEWPALAAMDRSRGNADSVLAQR